MPRPLRRPRPYPLSRLDQNPQPATVVAQDWKENPWIQLFGGLALGIVPYARLGPAR